MNKERNLLKLLSDKECLQASKESINNSKIHKQTAESSAVYEHYGVAVSHLILSTEELTKALLFYTQGLGLELRNIPGIHLFFTDHIIKHKLATMVSVVYPMLKLFMGFLYKQRDKLHNPDLKIEYTEAENALVNRDESKIEALFSNIPEMMDWWEDANRNKNKGFYVDYSVELLTPMQVTISEYKQAFLITDSFEKQILSLISYFDGASEEDRQVIYENRKTYRLDTFLTPLIEARKKKSNTVTKRALNKG